MGAYRYGVLGAGRQGTAAAYDLAVRGDAEGVVLADVDAGRARAAAQRVNRLTGDHVAAGVALDATDARALAAFLEPLHAAVSAISYRLNPAISEAAVDSRTSMCDLGGHMGIVRRQLQLDARARAAGTCLVPDCGEAPGLSNNLQAHALTLLDEPEEMTLYDGGLPLEPEAPWRYALTFDVDGLTNEYDGTVTYVVDGRPVEVDCLDPAEDETVEWGPPFGTLEAFAAATASTTPWTLGPRLRTLKSKVLRYPGHAERFRAYRDLGLFGQEPVAVAGAPVVPRQAFHALLEPRISPPPGTPDVVLARAVVRGRHGGSAAEARVDLRVDHDPALGFTAMQRATGWHAAIVCRLMASGRIEPGARPVELAVEPAEMMSELQARGFELTTTGPYGVPGRA